MDCKGVVVAAGSVSSLPGHIARRFHLRELRAALRQARRQQGSPEHVAARRQLQRATRQARQAHRDDRAERLEGQFLTDHDAAGFHQAYRGPRAELPEWVLREPLMPLTRLPLPPRPPSLPTRNQMRSRSSPWRPLWPPARWTASNSTW